MKCWLRGPSVPRAGLAVLVHTATDRTLTLVTLGLPKHHMAATPILEPISWPPPIPPPVSFVPS